MDTYYMTCSGCGKRDSMSYDRWMSVGLELDDLESYVCQNCEERKNDEELLREYRKGLSYFDCVVCGSKKSVEWDKASISSISQCVKCGYEYDVAVIDGKVDIQPIYDYSDPATAVARALCLIWSSNINHKVLYALWKLFKDRDEDVMLLLEGLEEVHKEGIGGEIENEKLEWARRALRKKFRTIT